MSSLLRRIQRQLSPSQKVHPTFDKKGKHVGYHANPPRKKFWQGRGQKLGVTNPKGRELVARTKRERSRA